MSDGRKNIGAESSPQRAQGRNTPSRDSSAEADEKEQRQNYVLKLREYNKLYDEATQNISKLRAEIHKDKENNILEALKAVLTAIQAQDKTESEEADDSGIKNAIASAKGVIRSAGTSNSPKYQDFEAFFQYAWGKSESPASSLHDFEERLKAIISLQQKIHETCQSIEEEITSLSEVHKARASEKMKLQAEQTNRDRSFTALEEATERLNKAKHKLWEVGKNETAVHNKKKNLAIALLEPKNLWEKKTGPSDEKKPEKEKRSLKDIIAKGVSGSGKHSRK